MANVFTDILKFVGGAFRGAAALDFLRDYKHASELFVGNDFSLMPKSTYMFHAFFDINPFAAHSSLLDSTRNIEIGMMVREVELPKFTIDTKTYNAYNRPNIVQTKIKYDQVTISFRDDSVNLIRNFWFDYYSYYFKDTLNPIEVHRKDYKYNPGSSSNFGYSLRSDLPDYRYLHAVRIYSLTHNQFTEYILINPTITAFRHPKHDYESNETANMAHEMTLTYEGVFYNEGTVGAEGPKGFASLHYDRTPSPLNRVGARRTIFGRNGLINTAGSIIGDITKGNYLSAIFKFATARQSFKGVNIAKAARSELKNIFTVSATNAVTGLITNQMRTSTPGGYNVVSPTALTNATGLNSLGQVGSALALTGVAALLNSRGTGNKYVTNPVTQSSRNTVTGNYKPQFPSVPGILPGQTAPANLLKANDANTATSATNQNVIDKQSQLIAINRDIGTLQSSIRVKGQESTEAQRQVNNLTIVIANLNNKLQLARSSGASQAIIEGIQQQLSVAALEKTDAEIKLNSIKTELLSVQNQLNQKIIERNGINA